MSDSKRFQTTDTESRMAHDGSKDTIDILMITYNRPSYTRISLERLLETCDENMRVWVWHNGEDRETLEVVKGFRSHPRFHEFHHSPVNAGLQEPTNWLWERSAGEYLTKVDDDCLMPSEWADSLRSAHAENPEFGVVGCWRFPSEDFVPQLAERKIRTFGGGHRLMLNCWVEGSGYLMKRRCVSQMGTLRPGQSFPNYCIRLAAAGWTNGWYYPFLYQEHFDDPRSPHSLLRTDADMRRWAPLSATNNGVETIADWRAQLHRSARLLQKASPNPKHYTGWRLLLKRIRGLVKRILGIRRHW